MASLASLLWFLGVLLPAQESVAAFGFGPPAALNTDAATDSRWDMGPQLATDGTGNWIAVWHAVNAFVFTDYTVFVSRSTDNGTTWTQPFPLYIRSGSSDLDAALGPQVETDGAGNWIVVWVSDENLDGTIGIDRDLFVSLSTDNGVTWTPPTVLNSNASADWGDDERPRLLSEGAGKWLAIWDSNDGLDSTIGTDRDILISRSADNGLTWSSPTALNSNAPTDSSRNDYEAQAATDRTGNLVVVWMSYDQMGASPGEDFDIFVCCSADGGATWNEPASVNAYAAIDTEDDMRPHIATDGAGNWVTVWYSDNNLGGAIGTDHDILVSRSTDNGASWTAPVPLNTNSVDDSGRDDWCRLDTDGAGSWLAVWQSNEDLGGAIGTDRDIFASCSTDNGVTWADPVALGTNAGGDIGQDMFAQLGTDCAGQWVVAWNSNDPLGSTIDTDEDILFSTSDTLDEPEVPLGVGLNLIVLCGILAAGTSLVLKYRGGSRRRSTNLH